MKTYYIFLIMLLTNSILPLFGQLPQAITTEQVLSVLRSRSIQGREILKDYERAGIITSKIIAGGTEQNIAPKTSVLKYKNGKPTENIVDGKQMSISSDHEQSNVFEDENYSWHLQESDLRKEIKMKFMSKNTDKTDFKEGTYYLTPETYLPVKADMLPGGKIEKKMSLPIPGKLNITSMTMFYKTFRDIPVVQMVHVQFQGNLLFTNYDVTMKTIYEYK